MFSYIWNVFSYLIRFNDTFIYAYTHTLSLSLSHICTQAHTHTHPPSYTLHPTHYTLHPTPNTLHYTLNPKPYWQHTYWNAVPAAWIRQSDEDAATRRRSKDASELLVEAIARKNEQVLVHAPFTALPRHCVACCVAPCCV